MTYGECACGGKTVHAHQEPEPKRPRQQHKLCVGCGFSWGVPDAE